VFLDIDAAEFPAAEESLDKPGVIWVFREDAPVAGTRVKFAFPSEPGRAAAAKSGGSGGSALAGLGRLFGGKK
jgi:hypothetical protein